MGNQIESRSLNNPKSVTDMGVSSTLKELNEEVLSVCKNAQTMRDALGIQNPEVGTAVLSVNDLASLLRGLLNSLRSANGDFSDCIRHLNS
jgi:hypothetical protein